MAAKPFVLLVTGGRVRVRQQAVEAAMDRLSQNLPKPLTIIHGKAKGTDMFADHWARDRGHTVEQFPVDGKHDGYSDQAPKMRNWRMLDQGPDAICGFPGGPGTRHMLEIAHKARFPIYDVELEHGIFRIYRWGQSPKEKAIMIATGSYE